MVMQVNRRLGSPGAPTTLQQGQLSFNDPQTGTYDGMLIANDTHLYIGSEDSTAAAQIRTLVGPTRQLELAGPAQTIAKSTTIAVTNLHITGGAANNILQTNGTGTLSWTAAPSGGLLAVETDGVTLSGNGTSGSELAVVKLPTARDITIQTAAAAGNGAITTISITPASFDGSANGTMTGFAITRLDDGTY